MGKLLAGATMTALMVAVVVGTVHAVEASPKKATVERVIDGDTVDVLLGKDITRIRLLNVDTPESKHPNMPVQCLAEEATAWLQERLPEGTSVTLEYDEERHDVHGRTLAGVFVGNQLINEEIARAGLGVPMLVQPNRKFLPRVEAASKEAQRKGVGLFDPVLPCTLPAQVASTGTALDQLPADAGLDSEPPALLSALALQQALASGNPADVGVGVITHLPDAISTAQESVQRSIRTYEERVDERRQQRQAEEQQRERERQAAEAKAKAEAAAKAKAEAEAKAAAEERERQEAEARKTVPADKPAKRKAAAAPKKASQQAEQPRQAPPASKRTTASPPPAKKTAPSKTPKGKCTPYGPEIPYANAGGYTGPRYGMPGGKTFRKCR